MKKKTIAILMAAMLICGGAIGATVAWLTDTTAEVTNTFTYGNVDIELREEHPAGQTAKMIPGNVIEKDPKVTVQTGSEPCYVFVEITPSSNYATFFGTFENANVKSGWTYLTDEGTSKIYYQEVSPNGENPLNENWTAYILQGTDTYPNGAVKVLDTVTKQDMDGLKAAGANGLPTLSFKAYAVQKANINTASDAWAKVKSTSTPTP